MEAIALKSDAGGHGTQDEFFIYPYEIVYFWVTSARSTNNNV